MRWNETYLLLHWKKPLTGSMVVFCRNLAIDGGHEVCGAMYNKQILTPFGVMIPQLANSLQSMLSSEASTGGDDLRDKLTGAQVFSLTENILTLFWCLSETSNKILNAINQMTNTLGPFLLGLVMNREKIPGSLVLAAAQCLYSITLDNPPFTSVLLGQVTSIDTLLSAVQSNGADSLEEASPESVKKEKLGGMDIETQDTVVLQKASIEQKTLFRVLIAGVLHNLQEDQPDLKLMQEVDHTVVEPVLRPVLDLDLHQVVQQVEVTVPEIPSELSAEKAAVQVKNKQLPAPDHKSPAEIKLDAIEKRLSTVMVALEVMTSMCAGLVDPVEQGLEADAEEGDEEEEDIGDGDDDDDMQADQDEDGDQDETLIAKGRDQLEGDDSMMVVEEKVQRTGKTSLKGLVDSGLHAKLFSLARPTSISYPPVAGGLSVHPPTTAFLSSIHLRALEALNNLLLTISSYAPAPTPPLPAPVQDQSSPEVTAQNEWRQFIAQQFTALDALWNESFQIAVHVLGGQGTLDDQVLIAKGQEIRGTTLEVLSGVWVGLARIGAFGGINVNQQQVEAMLQIVNLGSVSSSTKARLVSALGVLCMTPDLPASTVKIISDSFFTRLTPPQAFNHPEQVIALLNAIFDIFSDERCTYDQVFSSSGYLNTLAGLVSKCKAMTRAVDKRKKPELRVQAEEAYENLTAFIKYRRSVA